MADKQKQLQDFTDFHGMFVNPVAASSCVEAFNGTILFMPLHYKKKGIKAYHVQSLSTLTYYALVLSSFTGLSTILQQTEFINIVQDFKGVSCPEITQDIVDYIKADQNDQRDLKVIRRFEYNFKLSGVKVKMFHLHNGKDDKLHLVEIYELNSNIKNIYKGLGTLGVVIGAPAIHARL